MKRKEVLRGNIDNLGITSVSHADHYGYSRLSADIKIMVVLDNPELIQRRKDLKVSIYFEEEETHLNRSIKPLRRSFVRCLDCRSKIPQTGTMVAGYARMKQEEDGSWKHVGSICNNCIHPRKSKSINRITRKLKRSSLAEKLGRKAAEKMNQLFVESIKQKPKLLIGVAGSNCHAGDILNYTNGMINPAREDIRWSNTNKY